MRSLLPAKKLLQPLFWDTDFDKLDAEKNQRFIIERAMQYGRSEHILWLASFYDPAELAQSVMQSRQLDKRTANFWAIHLGIPKEKVRCLNPS
jgi:hypothetical protein